MSRSIFRPVWPTPENVHSVMTTRLDGESVEPFDQFNLGVYVGDEAAPRNRARLRSVAGLPNDPVWLHQVHSTQCVAADATAPESEADASWTATPHTVLATLAADCLPVLFASRQGKCVAAAHAGWRGLVAGVLENTISAMPTVPSDLIAWMGPAIGPTAFEVGDEVRAAFCDVHADDNEYFARGAVVGKWYADIFALARARLERAGVHAIFGGGVCTVAEVEQCFSHRRDNGKSGRMAALIWMSPPTA